MNKSTSLPLQKVISLLLFFLVFIFSVVSSYGQDCADINDFSTLCIGGSDTYPASTAGGSAPVGNDYDCLDSTPSPKWFYFKATTGGSLVMNQTNSAGVDVDGAVWGPFTSVSDMTSKCGTFGAPLDCDYLSNSDFSFNITAFADRYYAVLVTNFSGVATDITLSTAGSTAATDCSLDSDGDNVADVYDFDDDNDGILDVDEQSCTTTTTPAGNAVAVQSSNNVYNEGNSLGVNDGFRAFLYRSNSFLVVDLGQANPAGSTIRVRGNRNNINVSILIDQSVDALVFENNRTEFFTGNNANIDFTYTLTDQARYIRIRGNGLNNNNNNRTLGIDSFSYTSFSFTDCTDKNTDGDGFVDRLDVDSDADGCYDALEGSNTSLTLASVDGSGELTGGVNATTGVPTVVGTGQSNVSATDNSITSDECDDDGDGVINKDDKCPGFNDADDADSDGVPDGCDLDDDNDGILDTVENTCVGSISYEFYDSFPSSRSVDDIPITGALATGTVSDFDVDDLWQLHTGSDDNTFSIRYKGFVNVPTTGLYTFYTSSDDGSKLYINGLEVVDNDGDHGIEEASGQITLNAGVKYNIEVLFYENGGGEFLNVQVEGPSISKQNLPFGYLSCIVDTDNDGTPDYLDLDSDGDGCSDALEAGTTADQTTNYQFPSNDVGTNGVPNGALSPNNTGNFQDASNKDACTPDLSLTQTVNNAMPKVGNNIEYILTVKNNGNFDATDVEVTGVISVSGAINYIGDDSGGTYTAATNKWVIGNLAKDDTVVLTVEVNVLKSAKIVSTAQITASNPIDVDSAPNNSK